MIERLLELYSGIAIILPEDKVPYLLSLQTLGLAITTFCVSQIQQLTSNYNKFSMDYLKTNREHKLLAHDFVNLRSQVLLFRVIEMLGTGYFVSILFFISSLLFTDNLKIFFFNISFILSILPTVTICILFMLHRLRRYRLESIAAVTRFFNHTSFD